MSLKDIKNIAIIGASNNSEKYGNKIVKNLKQKGFNIYPVNPNEEIIENIKNYKNIDELPEEVQLIVFVVPAKIGLDITKKAYENGFKKFWYQPGAESIELERYLETLNDIEYNFEYCIMVESKYLN
ncbi:MULTISPECIES: CoA-binding protein [Oceanotoga]|uniref:CoA-binding protein n=1 Tax=Oceanotoga TaxID=1255275 RepID=UPI00352ECE59